MPIRKLRFSRSKMMPDAIYTSADDKVGAADLDFGGPSSQLQQDFDPTCRACDYLNDRESLYCGQCGKQLLLKDSNNIQHDNQESATESTDADQRTVENQLMDSNDDSAYED